uniref:Spike glycoprotein n=1 Tax=Bat coronavirus HKU5 TaxID=694008 RepID=UPI0039FDE1B1
MGILPSPGMPALLSLVSLLSVLLMGCVAETGTQECDFTPMLTGTPPPIYNFKRLVFTNCNYNLTKLLSLFQVSEFSCHQVSPSSLATGCYSSLTVDYFAYSTDMSSYLQPGSAGEIVQFNYKQDFSNPTCRVLATVPQNLTTITKPSNYAYLTECYKTSAYGKNYLYNAPGGYTPCLSLASRGFSTKYQSHSDGELTTTGYIYPVTGNLQMAFIISVQYGTDTNSVCPMQLVPRGSSSGGSGLNDIFEAQKIEWHEGGSHHHHHHHH